MTDQIAKQLTRFPRFRTRIIQLVAGAGVIAITFALAIVSGREPPKTSPNWAHQTLIESPIQSGVVSPQIIRISSSGPKASEGSQTVNAVSLLRPALEPKTAEMNVSAWAATAQSVSGDSR